jgi:hypothetical protein
MKKILFLFVAIPLLQGCVKIYDLEERLTIDVSLVDENDQALSNANVDVYADNYNFIIFPDGVQNRLAKFQPPEYVDDLISFNETNIDGKARMHFPRDGGSSNNNDYQVVFSYNEEGMKPLSVYLTIEDFENFYYEIPTQTLYKQSNLVSLFITEDLGPNFSLVEYEISGNIAYDFIITEDFETPRKYNFPDFFEVQKQQTILLNYTLIESIDDGSFNLIDNEVFIEVGDNPTEYIIQNP